VKVPWKKTKIPTVISDLAALPEWTGKNSLVHAPCRAFAAKLLLRSGSLGENSLKSHSFGSLMITVVDHLKIH
jgi:hypothetical protein